MHMTKLFKKQKKEIYLQMKILKRENLKLKFMKKYKLYKISE